MGTGYEMMFHQVPAPEEGDIGNEEEEQVIDITNLRGDSGLPSSPESVSFIPQYLTPFTTFITIIKCAVGGGSFSLPYAFQLGGVYASFIFTIFLGFLCFYTIDVLIYCERRFVLFSQRENINVKQLSYSQMGSIAFPQLTVMINSWEVNLMALLINVGIFLTCIGVSVAYIDIIASIYPSILSPFSSPTISFLSTNSSSSLTPSLAPSQSPSASITPTSISHWLLLPFLLLLSLISNYRYLVTTSTIGAIAVYVGLILVVLDGWLMSSSAHEISLSQPFIQPSSFNQYISRTCFLFAIHIVIIPIAQDMRPSSYSAFRRVLFRSYSVISISNALFGCVVYLLYSPLTCPLSTSLYSHGPCPNILDSLSGGLFISTVKSLICLDLLFSIPLILSSARELLITSLLSLLSAQSSLTITPSTVSLIVRLFLPFFLLLISTTIPDFGLVIDLVGGVCNSLMGFVLPPIFLLTFHHRDHWRQLPLSYQRGTLKWCLYVGGNLLIVVFGFYLMILTTHSSLKS
jgi:solute carrier family 36 (proton-coupled amino acid transporter)